MDRERGGGQKKGRITRGRKGQGRDGRDKEIRRDEEEQKLRGRLNAISHFYFEGQVEVLHQNKTPQHLTVLHTLPHQAFPVELVRVPLPELRQTLGSDVLTRVLNASQKVGDELVDGAFVLHGSRNTLSHFNLVALTVRRGESWSECCDTVTAQERLLNTV